MIDGLPQGVRSKVYTRIVDQLKTDPVLANVVQYWNTWSGNVDEAVIDENPSVVAIQLTPRLGPTSWSSPDAHRGALIIQIEMFLPGGRLGVMDAQSAIDVFETFENAIYPVGQQAKRQSFEQALRDLGAVTGQIVFTQPAQIAVADSAGFYLLGSMSLEIHRQLDA
jgi:hypothetical protein